MNVSQKMLFLPPAYEVRGKVMCSLCPSTVGRGTLARTGTGYSWLPPNPCPTLSPNQARVPPALSPWLGPGQGTPTPSPQPGQDTPLPCPIPPPSQDQDREPPPPPSRKCHGQDMVRAVRLLRFRSNLPYSNSNLNDLKATNSHDWWLVMHFKS